MKRQEKSPSPKLFKPTDPERRKVIRHTGVSILAYLVSSPGCVGGSDSDSDGVEPAPDDTSRANSLRPTVAPERYRNGQKRLFQSIPAISSPARIAGGAAYGWNHHGGNFEYVDIDSGWAWDHAGGDWIDANRVRQGPAAWFSFTANAAVGSTAVAAYSVNVTNLLRTVQQEARWNAILLKNPGAPRVIAGVLQDVHARPAIDVTYSDGSVEILACLFAAEFRSGTRLSPSGSVKQSIPAALEFERPTKPVKVASLRLTVVEHWSSGGSPVVSGFLLDPPHNVDPVASGVAASSGPLDAGITGRASVIGAHRYVDGANWLDFAHPTPMTTSAEHAYDPAIYGVGATDTTKLPHLGLGKWINAGSNFSLVSSTYAGEGFAPLAPGLGALRVVMPAEPGLADGSIVGNAGTLASNAKIFLPEPDFGRLKRIFVRYYLRLQSPYATPFTRRYQVYHGPGTTGADWTNLSGKIGVMPAHDTSYGGVSGSSGGGYGWQMRLSWFDCDTGQSGPNDNALGIGLHTYDFQWANAPFQYGVNDRPRDAKFGQRGGLGGVLYPGYWYCLEAEVDLNTVNTEAPGYLADGAVRLWLDGRLCFERTGMVMRSLPLYAVAADSGRIRPIRELGHRDLWFNWFHGGKTVNSIDRTIFLTGLVWAREYIGPMKLA